MRMLIFIALAACQGPIIGGTTAAEPNPSKGEDLLGDLVVHWPGLENARSLVDAVENGNHSAHYTVTFSAVWSAATHPTQFPPNPHFSGLIGGNHHGLVTFWATTQLASPGIENMAETGSKFPLTDEVEDAITAGTAGTVLSGNGIPLSPGNVALDFEISRAFPLVTLVSMIAPSPDWFVGVNSLPLFQDSEWVEELVVTLYPYDAGTDSGPVYLSANQETVPPEPIFRIEGDPFLAENSVAPLGTFTFTRTDL